MSKKVYISFLFLCLTLVLRPQGEKILYADISKQDAVKLLDQINHWFLSTASYSVVVIHATYAGHSNKIPYEQKAGYFKKYESGFHSCVLGVHDIQTKNYRITIDSVKKMILVNTPAKTREGNKLSMDDYIKSLSKCKAIKMAKSGKGKTLRLEFEKKFPVAAYEFAIGKDDILQSITIFYAGEVKSKEGPMVKPKLSICFEKYETGIKPAKNEMNESEFFSMNKDVPQLKESYKEYTLIDQRIKNDKP